MTNLNTKEIMYRLLETEDERIFGLKDLIALSEDMANDKLHPAWRFITKDK
jgi:hypothetical protein